jgi:hypothetical protein
MAKVVINSALREISGRVGEVEFRRFNGRVVLQKLQQRRQPWSRRQHGQRGHFKSCTDFATRVRADPGLRVVYGAAGGARRKRPLNYWQTAVRDAANAPTITSCNVAELDGAEGPFLRVLASDDFEVVRVHFAVRDGAGAILSCGDGKLDRGDWYFPLPPLTRDAKRAASVVVTAFDRPGNFAIRTFACGK